MVFVLTRYEAPSSRFEKKRYDVILCGASRALILFWSLYTGALRVNLESFRVDCAIREIPPVSRWVLAEVRVSHAY